VVGGGPGGLYFAVLARKTQPDAQVVVLERNRPDDTFGFGVAASGYRSMSLTFYHSVDSTCAQKVRLVLAEKRLEWEEIRFNLRRGDQFAPEYLQLNPKAVVPTLVHEGRVVRESTVINEYIEDQFPHPPLRPRDAYDRARMRLLVKIIDDEVHPAIGVLSYAIFLRHQMNERMSPTELDIHFNRVADAARRERQRRAHDEGLSAPSALLAIGAFAHLVAQLADALTRHKWLAGSEYSLADAAALPYFYRARALGLDALWLERAEVTAWLDRALGHTALLQLSDPWGSPPFHSMVAKYAHAAGEEVRRMLNERRMTGSSVPRHK
jgi:glutathione S-transferase